jgi:hypothetical protein
MGYVSKSFFFLLLSNKTDTKGKFPGQSSETSRIQILFKIYRLYTIDAYHLHEFVTFEMAVTSSCNGVITAKKGTGYKAASYFYP